MLPQRATLEGMQLPEQTAPIVAIVCGWCQRQIRRVTLSAGPASTLIVVSGDLTPDVPSGGPGPRMQGAIGHTPRLRAARVMDASTDGRWHGHSAERPDRYRFVCRHRSAAMPDLNLPVLAPTLRVAYERASATDGAVIALTPNGPRVTSRRG